MRKSLFIIALLASTTQLFAQTAELKADNWTCRISERGTLENIVFKSAQASDTVLFFSRKGDADSSPYAEMGGKEKVAELKKKLEKAYGTTIDDEQLKLFFDKKVCEGPAFYVNMGGEDTVAEWTKTSDYAYSATIDGVQCTMTYKSWQSVPAIEITLTNHGYTSFQPVKAGLKLGIDTYMDKYPDWFGKHFPTLMMNEKTHFHGYLQTPGGHVLSIVSPQPIASWSVDYNLGYPDPFPHWFMGHRIESLNIDLMNALPLPKHCPQNLWHLERGESRTWTIAFVNLPKLDDYETVVHRVARVPMLRMAQTSFCSGDNAKFEVIASSPAITVVDYQGKNVAISTKKLSDDVVEVACTLPEVGLYSVTVVDGDKQAHGVLTAHAPWQWTLERAREAAWKYNQKATSHIESWYGFHSAFLAARYFPSADLDQHLRQRFDYLFSLLHDTLTMQPKYYASRIQNTSGTIGMLVDKYEAYGDKADLRKASRLADWLTSTWQRKDGAYVNHNTVYTSVIYVAKSILELVKVEQRLGLTNKNWAAAARRHYKSAKRAIDQLVASQGNFETEGQLTFEDGMISCSALQIGMLGLMQKSAKARRHYSDAMLQILRSHDCIAQLRVADARRRGGTMRYWEAQYDVQMLPNMFNSPHGWSAWRAYATYYAYLLTGEERWLRETFNAMGAFSNMVDNRSGDLRWAFVVDPYLRVRQACGADTTVTADSLSFGNPHPDLYPTRSFVIGEQYVGMISDWQTVNTQDNDVHELFKCMSEAVLTNAFVVEREDGEIVGYNCKATRHGDRIEVVPTEKQITQLHCNLHTATTVEFLGQSRKVEKFYRGWLFGGDEYAALW